MNNNYFELKEPLVSVIMTCFNGQHTLPDAISSLINQNYQNWELIFVDDGSTDQSLKIINLINDDRIKIFSLEENYGRGISYQKGLNESSGIFVMFLDCDDWWYSSKISRQIEYIIDKDEIMLVGSGLITAENYIPIGVRCNKIILKTISKNLLDPKIAFATVCMRKSMLHKYKFDKNMIVAQDIDFLQTLCMNEYFSNISDILYVYNESKSFNWIKMKNAWKNRKIGLKKYKNAFPFVYWLQIIQVNFKIIIYFILFKLKLENFLLLNRISTPSKIDLKQFEREKKHILETKSKLFKDYKL